MHGYATTRCTSQPHTLRLLQRRMSPAKGRPHSEGSSLPRSESFCSESHSTAASAISAWHTIDG